MPNPCFSHHVGLELATNPFFEPFAGFGKNIFPGFRIFFSPQRQQDREKTDRFSKSLKACLLFHIWLQSFWIASFKTTGAFSISTKKIPADWRNSSSTCQSIHRPAASCETCCFTSVSLGIVLRRVSCSGSREEVQKSGLIVRSYVERGVAKAPVHK